MFDKILDPNLHSWAKLISAYTKQGLPNEALKLYSVFRSQGSQLPDRILLLSAAKACAAYTDLTIANQIHEDAVRFRFLSDPTLGNALIDMFGKCKLYERAQTVFNELPVKDVISWTSLLSAYVKCGFPMEALLVFREMVLKGFRPNVFTMSSILPACSKLKCLDSGRQIHGYAVKNGFGENAFVTSALVDVKCVQNGENIRALELLVQMQVDGLQPNHITITSALPACSNLESLRKGKEFHAYIFRNSICTDMTTTTALVYMYAKCGELDTSCKIFSMMPSKDVVAWNTIIIANAMHGRGEEAVLLFRSMITYGVKPNSVTFTGVLSGCSHSRLVDEGLQVFHSMRDHFVEPDVDHYSTLVDILSRAGRLDEAYKYIHSMPMKPTAGAWGALLGGCRVYKNVDLARLAAKHLFEIEPDNPGNYVLLSNILVADKLWDEASTYRKIMEEKGISKLPGCSWIQVKNKVYAFAVGDKNNEQSDKISKFLNDIRYKVRLAGYFPNTDFVLQDLDHEEKEEVLCNHSEKQAVAFGLLNLNGESSIRVFKNLRICGDLILARQLFDKIPDPNLHSWAKLISAYTKQGLPNEALKLYSVFRSQGSQLPDRILLLSAGKACVAYTDLTTAKQIHEDAVRFRFLSDPTLGNALIDMFGKCKLYERAQTIFNELPVKDVISWTSLLSAYVKCGFPMEALLVFREMVLKGFRPNVITMSSILPACSKLKCLDSGRQIHGYAVKNGFRENAFVTSALVDVKCVQNGENIRALELLVQMQVDGLQPNHITITSALPACSNLESLRKGKEIHAYIFKNSICTDMTTTTALVYMYAKCGELDTSCQIFSMMPSKDVVAWNIIIIANAMHGRVEEAVLLFRSMITYGVKPNSVTFTGVLSGCSHSRLVDEGLQVFHSTRDHFIEPDVDHYSTLVDILSRAGRLDEAYKYVRSMPMKPTAGVWGALLGGCRVYKNVDLARLAAKHLYEIEPDNPGNYVLLSNILVAGKLWDEASTYRKIMEEKGISKLPGCSWIQVKNKVYAFAVGDKNNEQSDKISKFLNDIRYKVRLADYLPNTDFVLQDLDHEEKEEVLCNHSEKQAGSQLPDRILLFSAAKACAAYTDLTTAKQIHEDAVRFRFLSDPTLGNALIDMFGKCRLYEHAQTVFNELPVKDVISWTSLLSAYVKCGFPMDALLVFRAMVLKGFRPNVITMSSILPACSKLKCLIQVDGLQPNHITITSALPACSNLESLRKGKEIHAYIFRNSICTDMTTTTALVYMYAKCGELDTSWVLSGCSHSRLVDEGLQIFHSMRDHFIEPDVDHSSTLVDILSRAGRLEAYKYIRRMPMKPTAGAWGALLGGCRVYKNVDLARLATKHLFEIEPDNPGNYVLLSNILVAGKLWDEASTYRKINEEKGISKLPGCSWIQVKNKVYAFAVGDKNNEQSDKISKFLNDIRYKVRLAGYFPNTDFVLQDLDHEEKEEVLCNHSEKQAVAFGLLNLNGESSIR
ncbi:hypothetical protein RDABS01_011375, partial [Bienertia sinuspersici]